MSAKIIEYAVIDEPSRADLEECMTHHLAEGWQPFGGVSISVWIENHHDGDEVCFDYVQAVVKYER